jgi:dihydrolipoamide dehydrogenase
VTRRAVVLATGSGAALPPVTGLPDGALVIADRRNVIVGATFTGPGPPGLLHSATIAIAGEAPLERLWPAVPSFPTVTEAWLRLLEADGF